MKSPDRAMHRKQRQPAVGLPPPQSYDPRLFVETPSEDMLCCACRFVLSEPQKVACGHVFCLACVQERNQPTITTCPIDGKVIKGLNPQAVRGIKLKILSAEAKCSNWTEGCSFTNDLCKLESHVQLCPFTIKSRSRPTSPNVQNNRKKIVSNVELVTDFELSQALAGTTEGASQGKVLQQSTGERTSTGTSGMEPIRGACTPDGSNRLTKKLTKKTSSAPVKPSRSTSSIAPVNCFGLALGGGANRSRSHTDWSAGGDLAAQSPKKSSPMSDLRRGFIAALPGPPKGRPSPRRHSTAQSRQGNTSPMLSFSASLSHQYDTPPDALLIKSASASSIAQHNTGTASSAPAKPKRSLTNRLKSKKPKQADTPEESHSNVRSSEGGGPVGELADKEHEYSSFKPSNINAAPGSTLRTNSAGISREFESHSWPRPGLHLLEEQKEEEEVKGDEDKELKEQEKANLILTVDGKKEATSSRSQSVSTPATEDAALGHLRPFFASSAPTQEATFLSTTECPPSSKDIAPACSEDKLDPADRRALPKLPVDGERCVKKTEHPPSPLASFPSTLSPCNGPIYCTPVHDKPESIYALAEEVQRPVPAKAKAVIRLSFSPSKKGEFPTTAPSPGAKSSTSEWPESVSEESGLHQCPFHSIVGTEPCKYQGSAAMIKDHMQARTIEHQLLLLKANQALHQIICDLQSSTA